jgi:hypothetical protein
VLILIGIALMCGGIAILLMPSRNSALAEQS